MSSHWKIIFVLLPILMIELFLIAPSFVHPSETVVSQQLLSYAQELSKPEPLEHVQYLLFIFSFPLIFFLWLKTDINNWIDMFSTRISPLLPDSLSFGGQLLLVSLIALSSIYNPWFSPAKRPADWVVALLLLIAFWLLARSKLKLALAPKLLPWIGWLVAICYTALRLLTGVFTDEALGHSNLTVCAHFPSTFGEYQAVVSGKTCLVDFFPTYQHLSQYLMEPIFKIFGLNTLSFTVSMALFSMAALLAIYFVFSAVTKNALLALMFYIPFVCITFYQVEPIGSTEVCNIFNYYAIGPLRVAGPWLTLALAAHYWAKPCTLRAMLLFVASGLVAFNNLDFGIAGFGAMAVATSIVDVDGKFAKISRLLKMAALAVLGALAAFALVAGWTFCRSGHLPDMKVVLDYQKIYLSGFYALPMPYVGLYYVCLITWMASIFIGLSSIIRGRGDVQPMLASFLIWSGVYGCGTFVYYLGRSHWTCLVPSFSSWGISIMLLIWMYRDSLFQWQSISLRDKVQMALPLTFIAVSYSLCWSQIIYTDNPLTEWRRLTARVDGPTAFPVSLVPKLKACVVKGETVMIVNSYCDWLAAQVGVKNCYPFSASRNTLISRPQLDMAMNIAQSQHINKVFGAMPVEMEQALSAAGFKKIATFMPTNQRQAFFDTGQSFAYWQRRRESPCQPIPIHWRKS